MTRSVTIQHTFAGGTVVAGDPRPHHPLVQAEGFRWSRRQGFWYLPHSRDRRADRTRIDRLVTALAGAGLGVAVEVDDTPRPVAEREADREARIARRQDALDDRAALRHQEAAHAHRRAEEMASVIPMGQPILVGHHSESRDRRYRQRVADTYERGFAAESEAHVAAQRADASRASEEYRHALPATLRRIDRLECPLPE